MDQNTYERFLDYIPAKLRVRATQLIREATTLYENERHFEVVHLLETLFQECDAIEYETTLSVRGEVVVRGAECDDGGSSDAVRLPTMLSVRLFRQFVQQSTLYQAAKERAIACSKLVHHIADNEGWTVVDDFGNGCGVRYQRDAERGICFFKVVGDIDVSLLYVMGTIMELDLFSEWFPLCSSSQSQGDAARFHKSSYFVINAPWPFAKREVFVIGYGIDDLERNQRVLIVANSIDEDKETVPRGIRPPKKEPKNVRAELIYGGFQLQVTSPTSTRLSFIMSVDPKIPNIPQGALNLIFGKVMPRMLTEIEKASKRAMLRDSVYYQRRRERPDVYQMFRNRYNDVLQQLLPNDYEKYYLEEDY